MSGHNRWSVQAWDFVEEGIGFGYVSTAPNHPEAPAGKQWKAYLAPISSGVDSYQGWFATAEEAKAAVDAIADQIRAAKRAVMPV